MKRCSLLFALTLFACSSDSETMDSTADGGSSGDTIQWQLLYSGAISGEIEGDVLAVVTLPSTTSVAASDGQPDGPVLQVGVPLGGGELGDAEAVSFTVDFDPTTRCTNATDGGVTLTVTDGEKDTYAATFSGNLECDAGPIAVEGFFAATDD